MKLSPIVFFVYNRPNLTFKTLSALKKNKLAKYSKIIFFVDKPKNEKDVRLNNEVIRIIKKEKNFKSKKIIFRKKKLWFGKKFYRGYEPNFQKI